MIFRLRLRAAPNIDAVKMLRAALKTLLRRYGLKCLSVEIETVNQQEASDGRRTSEEA
jgi:hypothetical protein